MLFANRRDAGVKLAKILQTYRNRSDCLVVGLPRGGVVTAAAVAKELGLPLDVTCPRKIGAPYNAEYAIGAITETGEGFFNREAMLEIGVDQNDLKNEIEIQRKEAARRLALYRKGRPPSTFEGLTVILIDDGIATGATMKAAIRSVKQGGAAYLVVAVPCIPPDRVEDFKQQVDELYYLTAPYGFAAVGQFYRDFDATTDEEVIQCLS